MSRSALLLCLAGIAACDNGPTNPNTRTLTVALVGGGAGTVTSSPNKVGCSRDAGSATLVGTCSGTVVTGTTVTLTAHPAAGSVFVGWQGSSSCSTGSPTLDVNKVCIGTFARSTDRLVRFSSISAGFNSDTASCGFSDLTKDDVSFYRGHGCDTRSGRGFNIAILDPLTGAVASPVRSYDTWGDIGWYFTYPAITDSLTTVLKGIPAGKVVMISVGDDAGITYDAAPQLCAPRSDKDTHDLIETLQAYGSELIRQYCFRGSWSMIALSTGAGTGQVISEGVSTNSSATASTILPMP